MSQAIPSVTSTVVTRRLAIQRDTAYTSQFLLIIVGMIVFVVSASVLLIPQVAGALSRPAMPSAVPAAVSTTSGAPGVPAPSAPGALAGPDLQKVLDYARGMQPDDTLVQVRPGVFAKRSNVSGVELDGRTVYYAVAPHQSFDPLRTGVLTESDVQILNRVTAGDTLILIYVPKK